MNTGYGDFIRNLIVLSLAIQFFKNSPMSKADLFVEWLFQRIVCILFQSDWVIEIKNYRKSKKKADRDTLGTADFSKETIYLDVKLGTPKILIHELGHVIFGDMLYDEASSQPKGRLKKDGVNDFDGWEEMRVIEFEEYFFRMLTKEQIQILQHVIDEAKTRYRGK